MIEEMYFVLWIASSFWGNDTTVFSPVSKALNGMISLRNKLLMKGMSKDSDKRICRAISEAIAGDKYLSSFSYNVSSSIL